MALTQKYKKFVLHNEGYEIPESREPGERIRTVGIVTINRSVFKHSLKERELLKIAKAEEKRERH